jgi:glycine cleavage system H protein
MKYTDSHEWIKIEKNEEVVVGVSQYAQKELGDIVYVELPAVGKQINAGQEVAVLESTKAAADVYAPISGTITAINPALSDAPELVNQAPEKEGWLFRMRLSNPSEIDLLMDANAYQAMLNGA